MPCFGIIDNRRLAWRILLALFLAMAAAALLAIAPLEPQQAYADDVKEMHRLYNPNSGEHFYTASTYERDKVVAAGWRYEGVGWYAPTEGDEVYRLYNRHAGDHHYTKNSNERDMLIGLGWRYEGVCWYSGGYVELHRQYNPNARANNHNYTTSVAEKSHLVGLGWRDEGVGWYAVEEGAPVEDVQTSREKVLRFTNTCRAQEGRKPLMLDAALTAVAQARAEEIAESGQKSHVRPDGRKWHTILTDNWIFVTEAAENLCGGFTSAAGACRAWKISPGHYDNMVSGKYKKLGVGLAQSETGYYHWVQLFTD